MNVQDPVRAYLLRRHKEAVDDRNEMKRRLSELKLLKGQVEITMLRIMAASMREKLKAHITVINFLRDELENIKGF